MKKQLWIPTLLTTTLIACGGASVQSKDDAAQAAYNLRNTSLGMAEMERTARGLRGAQVTGPTNIVTFNGMEGKATIVGNDGILSSQLIQYEGYSEDGKTYLDGSVTISATVIEGAAVRLNETLEGKVEITGEYAASLELTVGLVVDAGEAANAAIARAVEASAAAEAAVASARLAAAAAAANAADAIAQAALATAQAEVAANAATAASAQAEVAAAAATVSAAQVALDGTIVADGVSYAFAKETLELAGAKF